MPYVSCTSSRLIEPIGCIHALLHAVRNKSTTLNPVTVALFARHAWHGGRHTFNHALQTARRASPPREHVPVVCFSSSHSHGVSLQLREHDTYAGSELWVSC